MKTSFNQTISTTQINEQINSINKQINTARIALDALEELGVNSEVYNNCKKQLLKDTLDSVAHKRQLLNKMLGKLKTVS